MFKIRTSKYRHVYCDAPKAEVRIWKSRDVCATQSTVNLNVSFDIGTGNAASGLSGAFADVANAAVTTTFPFRVVGLVTEPPGSAGTEAGAYNRIIVAFNNVTTKNATGI